VNSDSEYAHGEIGSSVLVAAFGDRESAHEAAKDLRDDGFHKIWIGVILGDETLKSENESFGAKVGRFFTGEMDGASLTQTLTRHGVSEAEALRVEDRLEPEDVILTVNGSNHPELAARIIEDCGGDILSGESFTSSAVDWETDDDRTGSELLGYADPTEFARGQRVDDEGMTRLRNERLLSESVSIPTIREDLFVMSYDEDEVGRT
jgi:hypothetical protein